MGLFLVWCHRLICIVLSLCKHACKEVCDVKQGIDPYPLLVRSCDRWRSDFVTFTVCKRSIFGFKRGKKAQCVSNRCKDLFKRKKYFGVKCTLRWEFVLNQPGQRLVTNQPPSWSLPVFAFRPTSGERRHCKQEFAQFAAINGFGSRDPSWKACLSTFRLRTSPK